MIEGTRRWFTITDIASGLLMIDLIIDFSDTSDKEKLFSLLKRLKPVRHSVCIKQVREKRSGNQSRYYQGCIVAPLAAYFGYTKDDMHEILKLKFNPIIKENRITGEIYTIGGSTKELDTMAFEEYQEAIRIWALTEQDFLIKLPNEY